MPDPMKPEIPRPEPVKELKSGEEHIAYGCLLFAGGLLAIAAVIYIFRDFFFNNVLYTIIALVILSTVIREVMHRWKGK